MQITQIVIHFVNICRYILDHHVTRAILYVYVFDRIVESNDFARVFFYNFISFFFFNFPILI